MKPHNTGLWSGYGLQRRGDQRNLSLNWRRRWGGDRWRCRWGCTREAPAQTLGPRHRLLQGGEGGSCGWGPVALPWVLTGSKLQGLLVVLGVINPLPKVCDRPHPHPGVHSFLDTISLSSTRVSALPHLGVGQVVTHNLLCLCLSSPSIFISPLALPL